MEVNKFIKIYDNCIPYNVLSNFLKYINSLEFEEAKIATKKENVFEANMDVRKTYTVGLNKCHESLSNVHWHNFFFNCFRNAYFNYSKNFGYCQYSKILCLDILKYNEGGFYKYHVDHYTSCPRTLSAILLLNNDYEGGNLCFLDSNTNKELVIENKPNRMIVWPSNFLFPHTVKEVKKGIRYSIVSWAL